MEVCHQICVQLLYAQNGKLESFGDSNELFTVMTSTWKLNDSCTNLISAKPSSQSATLLVTSPTVLINRYKSESL